MKATRDRNILKDGLFIFQATSEGQWPYQSFSAVKWVKIYVNLVRSEDYAEQVLPRLVGTHNRFSERTKICLYPITVLVNAPKLYSIFLVPLPKKFGLGGALDRQKRHSASSAVCDLNYWPLVFHKTKILSIAMSAAGCVGEVKRIDILNTCGDYLYL